MPEFNQKGPMGEGAMTGRRMGRCTNFGATHPKQPVNTESQIEENTEEKLSENLSGRGLGLGRRKGGRGQGMGCQHRFRGNV